MRVHRLIAILMMIEKNGKIKAKELASKLEVSTRTIYRDIEALAESGFPIYATTGPEGGVAFMDGYVLGIESDQTDMSLLLPRLMNELRVIPDKGTTAQSIEAGFQQIQGLLNTGDSKQNIVSERILIDQENWWGGHSDPFDIRLLIDALWSLESLDIVYKKIDGSVSERRVHPYGLVLKHTNWYLIAYCEQAKEIRTFRCERLMTCSKNGNIYQIPRNFNLQEHWQASIQSFTQSINKANEYLLKVQVPVDFVENFMDDAITWNKKIGDSYIGTINMMNFQQAKQDVLGLLASVKVLEPPELVEYVKEVLREQLEKYE